MVDPGPVVVAVALGARARRSSRCQARRGSAAASCVGAAGARRRWRPGGCWPRPARSPMPAVLQVGAQAGVGAVDLVAGRPSAAGVPASRARAIIRAGQRRLGRERRALPGCPRPAHRPGSPVQDSRQVQLPVDQRVPAPARHRPGRPRPGSSRSARRCRCTGAAPRPCAVPFFRSPVSSTTSTAPGHPGARRRSPRRSSRTASASQRARGQQVLHPVRAARPRHARRCVQQFFRGRSASSPSTNARARRRGSTRANRGPTIRAISSSN